MNRTLIATATLVLLGLSAPIGLGCVVLPVHAQEDGGDSQSDDAGADAAPATAADPDEAPAAATDPDEAPADGHKVICVAGMTCLKYFSVGEPFSNKVIPGQR